MTGLARFVHGATVTATHPITGHSVTGRWNANTAYLEFDVDRGHYRIPLGQLQGCTFTEETRPA
jgi:hypothetical protein